MFSTSSATQSTRRSIATILWVALFLLSPAHAGAISSRTLIAPSGVGEYQSFGFSVGTAGDVNGDGYADVVIGASGSNSSPGQAFVYYGGPATDDFADLTMTGEAAGDNFGTSVGTAGDMNGDGYADVIVGAREYGGGQGRAYVFYGGPGADGVADITLTGTVGGDYFGTSVSTAGDVNRDGYADVIVGAPGTAGNRGTAYLYFGGPYSDPIVDIAIAGGLAGDTFGHSVCRAGDVNGDGDDDVIVGAPQADGGRGAAYVFYGGPLIDGWADMGLTGAGSTDIFGVTVGAAGDVNADGYADVIVGAPGAGTTGRAFVYFGGPGPNADLTADVIMTGGASFDQFGYSAGTAGDVNGDGYADTIVGAYGYAGGEGRAYVYFGGAAPDGMADLTLAGGPYSYLFGYSVAAAGDVDGDGFADVVVGAYGTGNYSGAAQVTTIYPYQVLAPNGGEQWVTDRNSVVRWRGHDPADLAISYDGGSSWSTLASGIGGLKVNEYAITAPSIATEHAKVRLTYTGQPAKRSTSDTSDDVFRIVKPGRTPAAAHRLQLSFTGGGAGEVFGISVGTAGDVNRDGYADVIVGAYAYDSNRGRVRVYYGGPGADEVADLTMTGAAQFDNFGYSVGTAGDVNGDGYADMIVGAHGIAAGQGRAYVFFGGPGADDVADLTMMGEGAFNSFGYSVGAAGDVNGDGFSDVVVGAPGLNNSQGRAYVYHGGPGADGLADLVLTGDATFHYFGVAVGTAGDVNGDGHADVIVGAYGFDNFKGRAMVFYGGPGADAVADLTMTGEMVGDNFGIAVGAAGDLNGDGYSDVVVGAEQYNAQRGRAYVYFGGPAADSVADLTMTGESAASSMGCAVATAGDLNGDGYADLVVGAYGFDVARGRVYAYYGGPGVDAVPDVVLTGETVDELLGISLGTAGDVNGDGFADVIVGAYGFNGYQGRADLRDFNRYFVATPNGGETWNVGATKTVSWLGAEPADVWLSVDGGNTQQLVESGVGGRSSNSLAIRVPHTPSKFARIKVTPADRGLGGSDRSDSLFTIQTSVALLAMLAAPLPQGGAAISWESDPGPADLAGYRLERTAAGSAEWRTIVALTRETSYTDPDGSPGSRYRLSAVNGFGEELWLGEAMLRPLAALAAWPRPYRGGDLSVNFATYGGLGGGMGDAEVSLFDVRGRLVRTLVRGHYAAGYQSAKWDGRDEGNRRVAAGVYFLRARSAGQDRTIKLTVLR